MIAKNLYSINLYNNVLEFHSPKTQSWNLKMKIRMINRGI